MKSLALVQSMDLYQSQLKLGILVLTAPMGARLAHRLPVATLKRIFALLMYVLATKMVVSYW